MSRTKVSVKSVYWDVARGLNMEPDTAINASGVGANTKSMLLRAINAAHEECYGANEWEDAWQDGTLTVTAGVIPFSDISDAARFTLWSADPRTPGSTAYAIPFTTSADGIVIQTAQVSSVTGFWLPRVSEFTDAESESLLVLESIAPAVSLMARAEYLRSSGQVQTAELFEEKARTKLEDRWAVEFQRVARKFWLSPTF